jgi:hypothetical protein
MNSYPKNVARRGKFFGSISNYIALLAIATGAGDLIFIWTSGKN